MGLFYTRLSDNMVQMQRRLDGTRQYEIVINNPTWPDPFQGGDVTVKMPTSVRVTDPDLVAPHTLISELSVEKTFDSNLSVSAQYVTERSANVFRSRNLNAPRPGETENRDPTRGQIVQLEATGRSRSRDLRLTARQRFTLFSLNASYSFGRAFTDVPSWTTLPSNNDDPGSDWGRAGGQVAHDFSATVNARLPWGLFLTGSHRWTSGAPYNITTGRDDNGDGVTNDRPAGVQRHSATGPAFQTTSINVSKAVYFGAAGAGGSGTRARLGGFGNVTDEMQRGSGRRL
jgi:hypothetical protein